MRMPSRRGMRALDSRAVSRGGFVLISVLIVLLALLILCAPYLATARNANHHSRELAVRAQLRLALDSAARHARRHLGASYPGAPDPTHFYDSEDEFRVPMAFDAEFLSPTDTSGVMWDLDVEDVAGRIDLASASPMVLANALGLSTRLTEVVDEKDRTLPARTAAGFDPEGGDLWVEGELVHYGALDGDGFTRVERGLGVTEGDEGPETVGPRPAGNHGIGATVLDQRVFGPVLWRMNGPDGLRDFDGFEELAGAATFTLAEEFGPAQRLALADTCTLYGGVRAGAVWQRPVRLTRPIEGGKTLAITVDDPGFINTGSTLRIESAGRSELALVQGVDRSGAIRLEHVLTDDYDAWTTIVSVQRRRPVDVNSASRAVLEVLFTGLQVRGRGDRITGREARSLAELCIQSRPLTGFEDFVRRVVLPSAGIEPLPADAPVVPDVLPKGGGGIIDPADAVALYLNARNANDGRLAFSTMPLCFTSRDTYRLDLRASINAPSGIERARGRRERVELIAPSRELFTLWGTQADFELACRLSRTGAWWTTGPEATVRPGGSVPPSRAEAHLGTIPEGFYLPGFSRPPDRAAEGEEIVPVRTFPSRDGQTDYAQLWASRVLEAGPRRGHVVHFAQEPRDPEGRYLGDETFVRPADAPLLGWADELGLALPISLQMWVKPQSLADGLLLDLGATSSEVDRITLGLEGGDLVLRVLDGFGDHRDSPGFREATEARFSLAEGDGPGLPIGTWSHLALDVEGSRPDQVGLRVNGLAHGVRRLGMSRLAASAAQGSSRLVLESSEGFPPRGVVRVGEELVEYRLEGNTLVADHLESGADAGQGGRIARTRWSVEGVPLALGNTELSHPAGTPVEVYGYSIPFTNPVPGGAGTRTLGGSLGSFRVARVIDTESGRRDPILAGFSYYGTGYEATNVDGLVLALADDGVGEVSDAFNPDGGYALLVQQRWGADRDGLSANPPNAPLGGVEIIRYSGVSGSVLHVAARGATVAGELPRYGAQNSSLIGGSRVFVIDWESTSFGNQGQLAREDMHLGFYVIPISLSVPGATLIDFVEPGEDRSAFAQITRLDQAELTEWVRYDTVQEQWGQLVRDHPFALSRVYTTITQGQDFRDDLTGRDAPGGGGGPGDGGGPGNGGGPGGPPGEGELVDGNPGPLFSAPRAALASATPPPAGSIGSDWDPVLGESDLDELPLSRAIWSVLQFRGVLGTFPHPQPEGVAVVPVLELFDRGMQGGHPGARDEVFLSGGDPGHLGWPLVVHRAHWPSPNLRTYGWTAEVGPNSVAQAAGEGTEPRTGFAFEHQFVALQSAVPEPFIPTTDVDVNDPRLLARMVKWPSGERPRIVTTAAVGGAVTGSGAVADAVVDELVFGSSQFLFGLPGASPQSHTAGSSLVLAESIADGDQTLQVSTLQVLTAGGPWSIPDGALNQLPSDAGILRLGDELLCYDNPVAGAGQITLAAGGRGLLGTSTGPHARGEPIAFLPEVIVSTLTTGIGPDDATIEIEDGSDFPSRGTVLIDGELVHYTRRMGSRLDMPRGSSEPGAMDERGRGIFRGRFGTAAAPHGAGTPVILFPFRYWDRWSDGVDAPELAYMGFEYDHPGALWLGTFFDSEPPGHGQAHLEVLLRTDPAIPWDEDPDEVDGLYLFTEGRQDDDVVPLGVFSDRMEWRVFVRYDPGAFDPVSGLAHGWKETPRLRRVGGNFLAPGRVLRSVDR